MNYLAHAYLSFNQPGLLTGNMISDFVKGKRQFDFPAEVQQGIRLHRMIDRYTDSHDTIREAKAFFRADYGLYSAAIVDVLFDHFLATDEAHFSETSLADFARRVYEMLAREQGMFPERFSRMFPYMKSQDWLYNYRHTWGAERSLEGLVHRARYMKESRTASRIFEQNYQSLRDLYREFFPGLREYALVEWERMVNTGEQNA